MGDILKGAAWSLLFLGLLHRAALGRVHQDAVSYVRGAFPNAAQVRVMVEPTGPFGALFGQLSRVDVSLAGARIQSLPLGLVHSTGPTGRIGTLTFHLRSFALNNYHVGSLDATLNEVRFNVADVILRHRLTLNSARAGPAVVVVTADDLASFVSRKYHLMLSDVSVAIHPTFVAIHANTAILGVSVPLTATGQLAARDRVRVDVVNGLVNIGGRPLGTTAGETLLQRFNPILDLDADFGLGGRFLISGIELREQELVVQGQISAARAN